MSQATDRLVLQERTRVDEGWTRVCSHKRRSENQDLHLAEQTRARIPRTGVARNVTRVHDYRPASRESNASRSIPNPRPDGNYAGPLSETRVAHL